MARSRHPNLRSENYRGSTTLGLPYKKHRLYRENSATSFRVAALALALILCSFLASAASAAPTRYELARTASQLCVAAEYLAEDLRRARGFNSARHHADRLSRDAGRLVDAINRNRSNSIVRSRFNEVAREYRQLETAFLRASRNYRHGFAGGGLGPVSDLFTDLNYAFNGSYYRGSPRHTSTRNYNRNGFGNRSSIAPFQQLQRQNQRGRSYGYGNRQSQRVIQRNQNRNDRDRQRGRDVNRYEHSSPVLQRQQRQPAQRPNPARRESRQQPSQQAVQPRQEARPTRPAREQARGDRRPAQATSQRRNRNNRGLIEHE